MAFPLQKIHSENTVALCRHFLGVIPYLFCGAVSPEFQVMVNIARLHTPAEVSLILVEEDIEQKWPAYYLYLNPI